MRNMFKKSALALLVTASVGMSTAYAAADNDALGKTDTQIYGVIGLASVTQLDCVGVNMGIWRMPLNAAAYSGTINVSAANNTIATAVVTTVSNPTNISQASDSLPGTGMCRLTGLISPTASDYKLVMTNNNSNNFISGVSTDVTNVANQRPAAQTAVVGMTLAMNLINATPATDVPNPANPTAIDLIWRLSGQTTFTNVVLTTANNYGGYKNTTPATVTVAAAL